MLWTLLGFWWCSENSPSPANDLGLFFFRAPPPDSPWGVGLSRCRFVVDEMNEEGLAGSDGLLWPPIGLISSCDDSDYWLNGWCWRLVLMRFFWCDRKISLLIVSFYFDCLIRSDYSSKICFLMFAKLTRASASLNSCSIARYSFITMNKINVGMAMTIALGEVTSAL